MILIGVGTGNDEAVSGAVAALQESSNAFSMELHDGVRIEIDRIAAAVNDDADKRLVFVSHGSQTALLDVARVPYLSQSDVQILYNSYVFAHACSTGAYLGREAVTEALVYMGFDAPISAPPGRDSICFDDVLTIYRGLLAFIQHLEYSGPNSTQIYVSRFLNKIRDDVLAIEAKHDTEDGSNLGAAEMICVLQFRSDICFWIKGVDHILKAAGAPSSPYLW